MSLLVLRVFSLLSALVLVISCLCRADSESEHDFSPQPEDSFRRASPVTPMYSGGYAKMTVSASSSGSSGRAVGSKFDADFLATARSTSTAVAGGGDEVLLSKLIAVFGSRMIDICDSINNANQGIRDLTAAVRDGFQNVRAEIRRRGSAADSENSNGRERLKAFTDQASGQPSEVVDSLQVPIYPSFLCPRIVDMLDFVWFVITVYQPCLLLIQSQYGLSGEAWGEFAFVPNKSRPDKASSKVVKDLPPSADDDADDKAVRSKPAKMPRIAQSVKSTKPTAAVKPVISDKVRRDDADDGCESDEM